MSLNPVADGYGVGTSIANAPVLNFALDIMEIEGKPVAKRGKWSGAKKSTGATARARPSSCRPGSARPTRQLESLLKPLVRAAASFAICRPPHDPRLRARQLRSVPLDTLRRRAPAISSAELCRFSTRSSPTRALR